MPVGLKSIFRYVAVLGIAVLCFPPQVRAQNSDPKSRVREARELARGGSEAIPKIRPMLTDSAPEVRLEAVKSIVAIGTQHSIDPLIQATRDNDAEIQIRAVDGIVNFYLPEYVQTGLQRWSTAVKARFDQENTQIVEPFVVVREDAIAAIGRLASGGSSMESRANAARALGILRGKAAIPDLVQALMSKNDALIFESLIALQKIGDPSAGRKVAFLLRDLQERVQIAAIETTGLLRNNEAVPDLIKAYNQARSDKIRRAAVSALAMIPVPENRSLFAKAMSDKDDAVRAGAAEGIARLGNRQDRSLIERAFEAEKKMAPRLANAFAAVALGNTATTEFAPLPYLLNTLNSRGYRNVAQTYLTELSRDQAIRTALYQFVKRGTKDEKLGIGRVLAVSGDRDSIAHLEALAKDPDAEVAQESLRAVRSLRTRLP
jgi:HEAT repeat protein